MFSFLESARICIRTMTYLRLVWYCTGRHSGLCWMHLKCLGLSSFGSCLVSDTYHFWPDCHCWNKTVQSSGEGFVLRLLTGTYALHNAYQWCFVGPARVEAIRRFDNSWQSPNKQKNHIIEKSIRIRLLFKSWHRNELMCQWGFTIHAYY